MSGYSLGIFQFINMTPAPPRPMQRYVAEMRPGVDGALLWNTGKRGHPYVCQTVVNTPTVTHAQYLFMQYQLAAADVPLPIVWAGVVVTDALYKILDVRLLEIRGVAGIGGVESGVSYGLLRCEWELFPLAVLDPP